MPGGLRGVGLVGVGDPAKTATSPEVWIGFGREAAKAACEAKCASLYLRKYWMDDKKGGATGFGAATPAKWVAGQGSE